MRRIEKTFEMNMDVQAGLSVMNYLNDRIPFTGYVRLIYWSS